jgi:diguanylate cyclase (GGDEF)-like protein/PAS domain S-box-containing protein
MENRGGTVASDLGVLNRVLLSLAAVLVATVGVASIFGWEAITRVQPSWPRIFPYTAGGMAALVIALILFARGGRTGAIIGRVLTAGVICLGIGVDAAVQLDWIPAADHRADRASLVTTLPSVATVFVATSILMLSSQRDRWPRLRFWLAAVGGLVPLLGLLSYVYGSASLFHQIGLTGLSMPSSVIGLCLVGVALTARPDRPPLVALDERYDSALVRHILPLLVAVPFLPALITRVVEAFDTEPSSARAVAQLVTIVVLIAIIVVAGGAQSRARRSLASERQRLWDAFANTPAATAILGVDGHVLLANIAMARLVDNTEARLIGKALIELVAEADRTAMSDGLAAITSGVDATRLDVQLLRPNGRTVWVDVGVAPVRDTGGRVTYVVVQCSDLTDRKKLEEVLSEQAMRDPLTGLLNREGLTQRLDRRAGSEPDTVTLIVYADVDNLKAVNDTVGHAAGDEVLREVSRRLASATTETDILARVGGDEFVIVTTAIDSGAGPAASVLDRLRAALEGPLDNGDTLSVSLGAAVLEGSGDVAAALAHADTAMYTDKRQRRGAE